MLFLKEYNEISSNQAKHIVKAQSNSFIFIQYLATVNISHNVVYKVIKQVSALEKHAIPICPIQVYDIPLSYFQLNSLNSVKRTLLLIYNMEMISKILPTEIITYANSKCEWFKDSRFQRINVNVLIAYHK